MGMLSSKAANPPTNPPRIHEFNKLPYQRTTAAPRISTSATAAALMRVISFQRILIRERVKLTSLTRINCWLMLAYHRLYIMHDTILQPIVQESKNEYKTFGLQKQQKMERNSSCITIQNSLLSIFRVY